MDFEWDVFISHASEDKELIVAPLVRQLRNLGVRVWYDRDAMKLGDSLRQAIDSGLSKSRFGVVVLSKAFFAKQWPQSELNGLLALEGAGPKRILPIWCGLNAAEIAQYSPLLADRLSMSSSAGLKAVATEIARITGALPAKPIQERPPLTLLKAVAKSCDLTYPRSATPFNLLDLLAHENLDSALAANGLSVRWEYWGDGAGRFIYWSSINECIVATAPIDGYDPKSNSHYGLFIQKRKQVLDILNEAGIDVHHGEIPEQSTEMNAGGPSSLVKDRR